METPYRRIIKYGDGKLTWPQRCVKTISCAVFFGGFLFLPVIDMAPIIALTPLLLAGFTAARQCSNFIIPVDISSRQGQFQEVPVENNLDVGAFATRFNEYQKNYTATLLQGYQTLQGSYNISAQYCHPDSGNKSIIQVLTHGIGFDKTWVSPNRGRCDSLTKS